MKAVRHPGVTSEGIFDQNVCAFFNGKFCKFLISKSFFEIRFSEKSRSGSATMIIIVGQMEVLELIKRLEEA
jgi:hypothetical protein